jgi:hypothetical protein
VVKVEFLANKTPAEVQAAIGNFSIAYVHHWQRWQKQCAAGVTSDVAPLLGEILRKWQATRPSPMRRPQREANHHSPYLEDLIEEALPRIQMVGTGSVRDLAEFTPAQIESLYALWSIFRNLTSRGHATCVGITKAVMLLTQGQICPALDSTVRASLAIPQPTSAGQWVECLRAISADIHAFESRHSTALEDLVPIEWQPIQVGRVYDMIAGPKNKETLLTVNTD